MNAMAAQGAAQRAPEIVIVHDGKPVESVSAGTQAATIGKYLAIAIVPQVAGRLEEGHVLLERDRHCPFADPADVVVPVL